MQLMRRNSKQTRRLFNKLIHQRIRSQMLLRKLMTGIEVPKLTFEEKKDIVLAHYQQAYQIKIDPNIHPDKVMELYESLLKLEQSERNHQERGRQQSFFKIVT